MQLNLQDYMQSLRKSRSSTFTSDLILINDGDIFSFEQECDERVDLIILFFIK